MAKNEVLHIRVNDVAKIKAEKTLETLGITISDVVNMLIHQIPLVGGIPFEVKIPMTPESVIIRSKEDLYEKLDVGMKQVMEGQVTDADVVMTRLKDKYDF